ncbi:LOW QUALITY PROTEIN: hypothetical protein YC2023_060343 [Brassica napus]
MDCLGVLLYKLRGLKDHAVKQQKDPTGSHGSKEQTHMRPFLLNVFFYRKFIHAKVMHRPTGKVISVATTNARNIRTNIPLIAERSMEEDVYVVSYKPRKDERIEGKLRIVMIPLRNMALFLFLDSLLQNICVTKKGLCFVSLMFIPKLVSYFILRNPKLMIV